MKDCLKHPEALRELYRIPIEFFQRKRDQWLWVSPRYSSNAAILNASLDLLTASLDLLHRLRRIADSCAERFASPGLRRFTARVQAELGAAYLQTVRHHLRRLRFPRGVFLRVRLGKGNEGTDYALCQTDESERGWLKRLFSRGSPSFSYTLHPRDEAGARALGELRDRGLAAVALAAAQAAEALESFFQVLRWELAFYLGCLNLYDALAALGEAIAFPKPLPASERRFFCTGLCDPNLALPRGARVVGNDVAAGTTSRGPTRAAKPRFCAASVWPN